MNKGSINYLIQKIVIINGLFNFGKNLGYHTLMEKIFKALGDKTRLHILLLISLNPDICLCDFEDLFNLSNSNLCRHLKDLEQSGLVLSHKVARWKHYNLSSIGVMLVQLIKKIDEGASLFNEIKILNAKINKN